MRDIGEGTIRRIDWQELIPVVLLLRIFNTATGLRVLFLSLFGILLTTAAGALMLSGWGGSVPETSEPAKIQCPIQRPQNGSVSWNLIPNNKTNYLEPLITSSPEKPVTFHADPVQYIVQQSERSVLLPWMFFTKTGSRCFALEKQHWAVRLNGTAWFFIVLIIWLWCGGMICRTVALRLTIDQSESFGNLRHFMNHRGLGFFSSIVIVAAGILFCLLIVKCCGWIFTVPILNDVMAVLFPIPMLFGFCAVVLLIGLWFGFPLLFAAVSVDGSDGFDAVSRMFSYVYQRPLHYFVYWLYSGILGLLGFLFVSLFVYGVVYVTVNVGGFPVNVSVPVSDVFRQLPTASNAGFAAKLAATWCGLIELLLPAYAFAWFWTSSVAIYLLLRRSVDATPFDEVYQIEKLKPKTVKEIDAKAEPQP